MNNLSSKSRLLLRYFAEIFHLIDLTPTFKKGSELYWLFILLSYSPLPIAIGTLQRRRERASDFENPLPQPLSKGEGSELHSSLRLSDLRLSTSDFTILLHQQFRLGFCYRRFRLRRPHIVFFRYGHHNPAPAGKH